MRVFVFGNWDEGSDNVALKVARELRGKIAGVEFVEVKPNEDLPFQDGEDVVVMDVVEGIEDVRLIEGDDLEQLIMSPRGSVHDWDLGWQLVYLKKLGKMGRVKVVGIPKGEGGDYRLTQEILRKLVAQDMQGS